MERRNAEHEALEALRSRFPRARLPRSLDRWRYVAQLALMHARSDRQPSRPWALSA